MNGHHRLLIGAAEQADPGAALHPAGAEGRRCGTTAFNYDGLSTAAVESLRNSAEAIRSIRRQAIADVGAHLLAAKELLPHGSFAGWAQVELGMGLRSAERYMRAAQFLAGKPDTVSHLPHAIIYKLSAPSAPATVVQGVVAAAEAGAPLSVHEIEDRLLESAAVERELQTTMQNRGVSRDKAKKLLDQKQEREKRRAAALAEEQAEEERAKERAKREILAPLVDQVATALASSGPAVLEALRADQWSFCLLLRDRLTADAAGRLGLRPADEKA